MFRKDTEGCNEVMFKPVEFDGFEFYKVSVADKMSATEKRFLRRLVEFCVLLFVFEKGGLYANH